VWVCIGTCRYIVCPDHLVDDLAIFVIQPSSAVRRVGMLSIPKFEAAYGRYTILIIATIVSLVPFVYMVLVSFMSLGEAINTRILIPSELRLENYGVAWKQARFSNYLTNSIIVTTATALGQLIICSLAGYAFAAINVRGRNVMFILVLATLMVPDAVLIAPLYQVILGRLLPIAVLNSITVLIVILCVAVWLCVLVSLVNTRFNFQIRVAKAAVAGILMLGAGLAWLSLQVPEARQLLMDEFAGGNWLNTYTVMIIPFVGNAYCIFLFRQFFKQLPGELWQAARLEGATHFQYFTQVAVPLTLPAFATIGLLSFIWSWNAFMWPRLTQLDHRGHFTLPVGLDAFTRDQGTELHLWMAGATITVIPVLLLYIFALRMFINSASRVGFKG
ncbi:MAG: carbohydrate ABC transporter permease, partial [Alphaproteobacteria bacterium]